METIKEVLMRRDGMSSKEADSLIKDCIEELNYRLDNGEDCDYICQEFFGLESDYIMELL